QVLEKSKKKFESAEALAKIGDYDSATALLIVSNENALVGLILFLDGIGFKIRSVKGMKSLFKNHKLRYLFALILSVFSIVTKEFKEILNKIMKDPTIIQNFNPNDSAFAKKVKNYFLNKLLEIKNEILFFSRVDKSRQQGLYSDFKGTLLHISESEYQVFHNKIQTLNSLVFSFIETFSLEGFEDENGHFQEHLDKMKVDFNTKYRVKLEKLLKKINSPKYDSYENMTKMVDEIYKELNEKSDLEDFMRKDESLLKLTEGMKKSKHLKKGK
ncbi:hypothetical protein, partial [Flavobacterium filum]|uniref:hypothetical protein n=1 Tax=Flavobacterium filum TaxID=370974 RepID=UPI0023F46568